MHANTIRDLGGLIPWMGLAQRIKEAMGDMSAAELARACKVTDAAVTFWLDGRTKSLRAKGLLTDSEYTARKVKLTE